MDSKAQPSDTTTLLALGAGALLLLTGASRRSVFWATLAISTASLLSRGFREFLEGERLGPDRIGYDDRTSRAVAAQNPSDAQSIELAR